MGSHLGNRVWSSLGSSGSTRCACDHHCHLVGVPGVQVINNSRNNT